MNRLGQLGAAFDGRGRTRRRRDVRVVRRKRDRVDMKNLVGRDLADAGARRAIPIWLIPAAVVCLVVVSLVIANLRIQLIGQGYERASAVTRQQQLEEEQRVLAASVRKLRDPARLAALAEEMGLARPERVIALAPPGVEARP